MSIETPQGGLFTENLRTICRLADKMPGEVVRVEINGIDNPTFVVKMNNGEKYSLGETGDLVEISPRKNK